MIRIIAGKWRGRLLLAPDGLDTRPTLGRTKEALFSMLYGCIEGAKVLDLFGGSGALALEALSRGASHAVIGEKARDAIRVIQQNIQKLGAKDQAELIQGSWEQTLKRLAAERKSFNLIFIDPPYTMEPSPVLQAIAGCNLLDNHGILVLEHATKETAPKVQGLVVQKSRAYRDTTLTIYERQINGESSNLSGQL